MPNIIFVIASSIGILVFLDTTTNKYMFDRSLAHYARILVDVDLSNALTYQIMIMRKFQNFYIHFKNIGPNVSNVEILSLL